MHNFRTFDLIHLKKRNKLDSEKWNELVYIHYNTKMQMRHNEEGFDKIVTDPIDRAFLFRESDDIMESWMDDVDPPIMDDLDPTQPTGATRRPDLELTKIARANYQGHLVKSGCYVVPVDSLKERES